MFKKILLAAAVLVSAASAIEIGPHIGGNMTTMYGDDAENVTAGVGFNAGVAAKVAFKDSPISIVPEVLIDMRNSGSDKDDNYSMTEWALEIPVMVRCELLGLFYFEAGPSFNFNLATSTETKVLGKEVSDDIDSDLLNTFEFGLSFGVGTNIISMLDIDFRVNMGITDFYAEQKVLGKTVQADAANLQFALGVSIWLL